MNVMQILFSLSIALFAGLLLSRLAKLAKLPAVTAYLIAGILIGPFCLGAFDISGLGFTHANIDNKLFLFIVRHKITPDYISLYCIIFVY